MQLKNNLYTVVSNDGAGNFVIALNPECFIYKAHFPGEPITPGVCIVQTVAELLSDFVGKPLEISVVKNVKFLSVITTDTAPQLLVQLKKIEQDGDRVKAQAVLSAGDDAKAKISLVCNAL